MALHFRKSLSWLHTWCGLVLGLVIVMLAITGAALVLRPQLDDVVNTKLMVVPACTAMLPLDRLASIAQTTHPAGHILAIEITNSDTSSIAVRFANDDYVYLNPCSGVVLGIKNHYAGLFGTMDWLHRFKFIGHGDGSGRPIAGWIDAAFLVILIAGGIVLWWPRTRTAVAQAFRFNWRARGVVRTLSLHKIAGIYLSIQLLIITVTGLPLGFLSVRNAIIGIFHSPVESLPPPDLHAIVGIRGLSMQTLYAQTRKLVPDLAWVSLYYPPSHSAVIQAEILERDAPHANAKSYLYLDEYNGQTLEFRPYATATTNGRKLYLYILALHSGLVGGLPYQIALLIAVLGIPVQVYSGFSVYLRRKFGGVAKTTLSLCLTRKTVEATDIYSFEFADPSGRRLPPFEPGAHIDVHLGGGVVRQYSLCGDPADRHHYKIAVLRHPQSRGGSQALHEGLKPGAIVEIGFPRNHFPLADASRFSLLIGGGIGITPILAMAEALHRKGADFGLHYCVNSRRRAVLLFRMVGFGNRFTLHVTDEGTRLHIHDLLAAHNPDVDIYVCGPSGFITAVLNEATLRGWPQERLHREYFEGLAQDVASKMSFEVEIASTGERVNVSADQSVVEALAARGIYIPTGCAEGVCGTCITGVRAGEIDHRDLVLTAEEQAKNDRFTPCCSRANGSLLVLDL